MSVLPLHPYQAEAVEAVKHELAAGRTRPLVVAPTGSGKTWILAELVAHFLAQGQRALLVVHREELVNQLAERVRLTVPDAWLGIEQAARRADPLARVEAFERSRLDWDAVPPARWILAAPEGMLSVRQTLLAYEVSRRARGAREADALGALDTLEEAVGLAEQAARTRLTPEILQMLDRRASWRRRPASDKQKVLLDRYHIGYSPETTRGDANRALRRHFAGVHPQALARQLEHQARQVAAR